MGLLKVPTRGFLEELGTAVWGPERKSFVAFEILSFGEVLLATSAEIFAKTKSTFFRFLFTPLIAALPGAIL